MKLSASYNYFNGEEHFLASLHTVRSKIDHISVVWQEISNAGEKLSERAHSVLEEARRQGLVEDIIRFKPNLKQKRRLNEKEKRRIGLETARRVGATHFLTLDTDEFYRPEDLSRAKILILENGWRSTSVESYCHVGRPIYRAKDSTCCCFITEIAPDTEIGVAEFPCENVDSTRRMTAQRETHHHFGVDTVAMYHMNYVRTDFAQKLRNSSTTDKRFLRQVERAVLDWTPSESVTIPQKGTLLVTEVGNEFDTYDPGVSAARSHNPGLFSQLWLRWNRRGI